MLGTRLGEPTSFWNPAMVPAEGFIHVDIDPDVPGVAYPTAADAARLRRHRPVCRALLDGFRPKRKLRRFRWALPELRFAACVEPTARLAASGLRR